MRFSILKKSPLRVYAVEKFLESVTRRNDGIGKRAKWNQRFADLPIRESILSVWTLKIIFQQNRSHADIPYQAL